MKTIIIFFLILYTQLSIASSVIDICLRECSYKIQVELSNEATKQLKTLFFDKQLNAEKERECIGAAIALMEEDIYSRISQKIPGDDLIDKMHNQLSNQDETYNTRNFLRYLLDHQYIRQHVLRRTEKRSLWFGSTESTSVIQSISPYASFAVDSSNTGLAETPLIIDINAWRKEKTLEGIQYKFKKVIAKSNDKQPDNIEYDFE